MNDASDDASPDADDGGDGDADHRRDSDIEGPEDVPRCGDGALDPEEECDDHNRINNDGCDWLCRLGDGEPPPEPDPSFPHYGYESEPVQLEGVSTEGMAMEFDPLPLRWTGNELATAFYGQADDDETREVFFQLFDEHGAILDNEWEVQTSANPRGLDLVWTGRGFALFYSERERGIFMLRLSPSGKLVSGPVLVIDDPCAVRPRADFTGDGHALAWSVADYINEDSLCFGEGHNPELGSHLSLLGDDSDASVISGPLHVVESRVLQNVAAGPTGFVLAMADVPTSDINIHFVDEAVSEVVASYTLSTGSNSPSVVFGDGQYWVAWTTQQREEPDEDSPRIDVLCIARFSTEGVFVTAPVCTALEGYRLWTPPAIAFGDRGLGVVVGAHTEIEDDRIDQLLFLRSDASGSLVGAPLEVDVSLAGPFFGSGPYAIAWTEAAFAVLYADGREGSFHLRRFTEAE